MKCPRLAGFNLPGDSGRFTEWLSLPARELRLLNLRTYVTHQGEPGIHFIAEWISSWFHTRLGPPIYSLPYRWGHLEYEHRPEEDSFRGRVNELPQGGLYQYNAQFREAETGGAITLEPSAPGTCDEFLLERYNAFNGTPRRGHYFRVWHEPWQQRAVKVQVERTTLFTNLFPWWQKARLAGANYSPGAREVWMSAPRHFDQSAP